MKIRIQNRVILVLCIACLSIGLGSLPARAQDEDRPVLGRSRTAPPPEPAGNKGRVKQRSSRRAAAVPRSTVPKGKTLEFYVLRGSELLDASDYEQATLYFEEAEKHRRDRSATPGLIELLDHGSQVAKLHLEAAGLGEADTEKALADYQEILKLRPTDQKAKERVLALYNKMGEAALAAKQYDRAADLFGQLSALVPEDNEVRKKLVEALLGRSEAELKAGREDQAQATYKRVLELDPKNQKALSAMQTFDLRASLEFAENKLKTGAYEDALKKFKEVLSLYPDNERAKRGLELARGNYQKLKADQFYKNRKYLDAEREYKEALAILSGDEQIKRRLDEISLRLGPPLPAKGKTTWRGKIAGPLKVMIKGKELSYPEGEVKSGGALSEGLPDVAYVVKRVRRVSGDASVRVFEQPSATNGYATVVALDAKKSENQEASFELEWELKRQGRMSWSGRVTGKSLLYVQGPFIDVDPPEAAKEVKGTYQVEGLPHQETLVKPRKISGKPEIRLLELPSQANFYTATIAVESPSGAEGEELSFELEWQLK